MAKNDLSVHPKSDEPTLKADWRWELAERIAHSPPLSRASQLRAILLFIVRRAILQPEETIGEFDVAHEALGRRGDFNPLDDSIVRVQVAHLRKKLDLYFATEGKNEKVVLTIAMGSYEPVFSERWNHALTFQQVPECESVALDNTGDDGEKAAIVAGTKEGGATPEISRATGRPRWVKAERLIAGLVILLLAGACIALWIQNRSIYQSFYAWKSRPAVSSFWSEMLATDSNTDVIVGDSSFALLQDIAKKSFPFSDYLGHGYIEQIRAQAMTPERREDLALIAGKSLGSVSEFRLAQRILALEPLSGEIRVYNASEYTPPLIKRDNLIVVGSRIVNPWGELFESRLNFVATADSDGFVKIVNRAPIAGEQQIYVPVYSAVQYCVVAYLPNPDQGAGKVLLIEGTGSEATEAAGDFLFSEDQLANFQKSLHVTKLPFFEVLLKISAVKGTPLTATVLAYRIHPN